MARLVESGGDYCANKFERTFPRGFDVEVFTMESFERVYQESTEPHHREHVTPYYRENPQEFETVSLTADQVFDEPYMRDRGELRITLDEADDYELFRRIYAQVEYDDILPVDAAIKLIDDEDLQRLNAHVKQKNVK
ncbi:hypothetical protein C2R22_09260 [Salinigranum rubrum]|uniref:Uncharacterized protein n=1 Tax=Salinigranum rubrum TaxID=755307 RepID=A0A2I8VIR5_9EURY|nr:hypothetical protein [Salinigranum rubrum]AUV81811.1 hypothetical protein C2R22_09260 [Salinigranum rubrum]